ncbi:hypothetical protein [Saprospira grandis]|uniref:DUF4435 domain-containing protein n=1 Tax=Saprospira grandis (strain Lewin) TaxID=984262 RepID=H6L5S9_SAPGL|nr:hypothetical protein [Saprospira grandis]AFC26329.1 hypothetical protein SGRA_3605 [Saprospira grandis str. Lewin]
MTTKDKQAHTFRNQSTARKAIFDLEYNIQPITKGSYKIICVVEGIDDIPFYRPFVHEIFCNKIESLSTLDVGFLISSGKAENLALHKTIKKNPAKYSGKHTIYYMHFVDRDFDQLLCTLNHKLKTSSDISYIDESTKARNLFLTKYYSFESYFLETLPNIKGSTFDRLLERIREYYTMKNSNAKTENKKIIAGCKLLSRDDFSSKIAPLKSEGEQVLNFIRKIGSLQLLKHKLEVEHKIKVEIQDEDSKKKPTIYKELLSNASQESINNAFKNAYPNLNELNSIISQNKSHPNSTLIQNEYETILQKTSDLSYLSIFKGKENQYLYKYLIGEFIKKDRVNSMQPLAFLTPKSAGITNNLTYYFHQERIFPQDIKDFLEENYKQFINEQSA